MSDRERNARERAARDAERSRAASHPRGAYRPQQRDYVSGTDRDLAGVPIAGWLSGANARTALADNNNARRRNEDAWGGLQQSAPTATELTPEYLTEGQRDEYGDLLMGDSEVRGGGFSSRRAFDALGELIRTGGYTATDRAASAANRARSGMVLAGQNQAALQNMAARGVGGGGLELAARLGGSQAANQANVIGDAGIQQTAMNRAIQAMQGYGQLGNALDNRRIQAGALRDAYNQSNYAWRRGRQTRNTATNNAQQDATTRARQQRYQNSERAVAGRTGQYNAGAGERIANQNRQDSADQAGAGIVSEVIDGLLG